MLQRVHIQILDNPMEDIISSNERFDNYSTNKVLAEELQKGDELFLSLCGICGICRPVYG